MEEAEDDLKREVDNLALFKDDDHFMFLHEVIDREETCIILVTDFIIGFDLQ